MELYILRHAWAGDRGDPRWPDDAQRPVSPKGRRRFADVVTRLARRGFAPEIIATSPLLRCVQTAELLRDGISGDPQVVQLDALRPGGNLHDLLAWTAEQADFQEIAWVGHAPDVGHLAAALLGAPPESIDFAKGGVAAIRCESSPQIGQGRLHWLLTAKVLGC